MKWRVSVGLRPGIVVDSISQRYLPAIPMSILSVASPAIVPPLGLLKFCLPAQSPFMKASASRGDGPGAAGCWARDAAAAQIIRKQTIRFIGLSCPPDDSTLENSA